MGTLRPFAAAAVLALALNFGAPRPAEPWGFDAHRLVHRHAIGTLPSGLREVFSDNADYVVEHAIDPDLERSSPADPDHFLDIDAFGAYPFAVGATEAEHLARHGAEARRHGRVHWRIAEAHAALVAAYRSGDGPRVLAAAATLGHLVADAHVPLHATTNHDGQLTGQRGLHSRWESELVRRFRHQIAPDVQAGAARPVGDPAGFGLAVVRESWLHVGALLESDRAAALGLADRADTVEDERYGDEYYSRLYAREAARVAARLSAAATAVGSYWLDAWEQAGRPAVPRVRIPYVRGRGRAVLLSVDAGGAQVFDDAVARGVMPHLAALRARGATARGSVSAIPTKTAPGHAALFTGAWGDRSGITGNEVPAPGGTILEGMTGYSSVGLTAEPLWHAAARQGLDATVASGTQAFPFATYFDERRFPGWTGRRLTLVDGYQNLDAEDGVWTAEHLAATAAVPWVDALPAHTGDVRHLKLSVAGADVAGIAYDDPADPVVGFDTVLLSLDRDPASGATLKPRPLGKGADAFGALTLPIAGGQAVVYLRLFEMSPDLGRVLLYHTAPHVLRSNQTRLEALAVQDAGGFVGNGAGWAYERGDLGPALWNGGDGTAERRYLETIALVTRQFTRVTRLAADGTPWSLLVTYLPYPDEALHAWNGRLDPTLPGHDPDVAAALRPHVDAMLRIVDEYIGFVVSVAARADAVIAVGADHGMTSMSRLVRPNVLLAKAGLLAVTESGAIDLSRTRAVYFPGNAGHVLVNRDTRPGGIVSPGDEPAVRRAVREALLRAPDPATGRPAVTAVIDADPATGSGRGGPRGGDLYLEVAHGYDLNSRATGDAFVAVPPRGTHFQRPTDPALLASFVIAGPGIAAGVDLGVIRQVDVAPTLAAVLGIAPPAQAVGRVLEAALAER